jgi:hypothetical protein
LEGVDGEVDIAIRVAGRAEVVAGGEDVVEDVVQICGGGG